MVAADVADDRLVHLVAADPHAARIDDAAQGDDGDLGGAAADIDDHAAGWFGDRQAGADRRGHRLLDQLHPAGAGAFGTFLDGAAFDRGGAGRDADDDQRRGEARGGYAPCG